MATIQQPRNFLTAYGADRGKPTRETATSIGRSATLQNAIIAATKRIVQGDYSSAMVYDPFGTRIVWLNTSKDSMYVIIKWLEE